MTGLPFGLRFFFRSAFLLLALATLALALNVLQNEKQRSHRVYAEGLRKTLAQVAARLRHPTGQLALLNPGLSTQSPLRPVMLPFAAIDFDDRFKAQQAADMAGCALQYPDGATACAAVGSNPYAGAFLYVVASFASGELATHRPGDLDFGASHRALVEVSLRGRTYRWVAPFEAMDTSGAGTLRGRLVGFAGDQPVTSASRPSRDFRGWLWQEGRCADLRSDAADCAKRAFLSVRLPVPPWTEALAQRKVVWPPPDLDQATVRLQLLPPGDAPAVFDSDTPGARLAFSVDDLQALLQPGETLRVRRTSDAPRELLRLAGQTDPDAAAPPPWVDQLVRRLPVAGTDAPVELRETLATPLGRHEIVLSGDVRGVNRALAAVATRLSWFVGAILLAVLLAWLALELRIIRRITLLTKRAAAVSSGAADIDLAEIRGRDELGVLAQGLNDLLRRVNDDARREKIRAGQEKDMWHAVGHEIMSPLQSLMALHGDPADPSHRYIHRMQQAVRVLYGQASPSEALSARAPGELQPLDLERFLAHVADNASYLDIADVRFEGTGRPVPVQADEYALEDVVTHVLRNATRCRTPGSPITIALAADAAEARVTIANRGPAIAPALMDRIFEYGVSDAGSRGQGLFVARTYMAKMGGTITARNAGDGAVFELTLPRLP